MSVFTSVGILILSMLIMASLQLIPGVFAILYHSLAGRFNKLRTSDTALFFILGVETSFVLIIFLIYLIINASPWIIGILNSDLFSWIVAGILVALGISFCFFYFQKGPETKLFISRNLAKKFLAKADDIKTRSDAFTFGFVSILPELVFTLPLFLISTLSILDLGQTGFARAGLIILFAIVSILPLLIIYILFKTNSNLADFIKFRFHNKPFFRFFITSAYLATSALIILGTIL